MNNEICIAAWIYGKKYQGWIPIYLYSITKNYPQYDVQIFLDTSLNPCIKNIVKDMHLANVLIIENYSPVVSHGKLDDIEKRCCRWLIDESAFKKKYQYIYIGDVDIFIEKEDPDLATQHIIDMNTNGRIYSNAIRLQLGDYMGRHGRCNSSHLFRLTGLHFFSADKYFTKVKKAQKILLHCIQSRHKTKMEKIFFSDDERCLWLLLFLAGMKLPSKSYEIDNDVWRPLHGLHFAIGREAESYNHILKKNIYRAAEHKKYYDAFVREYNEDDRLREIVWKCPFYIIDIINRTCLFWKDEFGYYEIKSRQ